MSFIGKLLEKINPLSWRPPQPPDRGASLEDKLEWVIACNEDITNRLGGSIVTIVSAFSVSRCARMLEIIDALLTGDMNMSRKGESQQFREDVIMSAIYKSVPSYQMQNMVSFYWHFFSDAYVLVYNDAVFARQIMKMSGKFDFMPYIFTQLVLEFACNRSQKR